MKALGTILLRRYVDEEHLTCKELAYRLGCSPDMVRKLLRGDAYPSRRLQLCLNGLIGAQNDWV